jgi:mannobiose 2-epimerase
VEWVRATGDPAALRLAWDLHDAIEGHAREPVHGGYLEALARDWSPLGDMALSERDVSVPKSMNTNLHVLEAYTNLLGLTGDGRVRTELGDLLEVCLGRIIADEPWTHCQLFFDLEWRNQTPNISFGHDIEASWLFWEAALAVGDDGLTQRTRDAALALADAVLDHGVDPDGSVLYEATPTEIVEAEKHWWPQAEGVVGWLNAYQLTGEPRYRDAALAAWRFIEDRVVDRTHGEWFSVLSREGEPLPGHPASKKMGPWKCPYHNARACLEVMRRVG